MFDDPQFVTIPAQLFRLNISNTALLVAGRVNRINQLGLMPQGLIPLKKLIFDLQMSRNAVVLGLKHLESQGIVERVEISHYRIYKWKVIDK